MSDIIIRELGLTNYVETWRQMRAFTEQRSAATDDEIWLVQHFPIFTQGVSCAATPFESTDIEVVHSDRGGQLTYHGPGQLVAYTLIDLRRRGLGIKSLVNRLEQTVIDCLAAYDLEAHTIEGAPGVYVNGEKIAALGLRVRRGATYHGLSFNIDMDLSPFLLIDPCGYKGLAVTQLKRLGVERSVEQVQPVLVQRLIERLG